MAKKRKRKPVAESRTAESRTAESRTAESRTAESRTPREPTFWFGFEIAWAKLVVARVVLFGLLAIDALLQLRHAPRYGAGSFNVAQLQFLDGLGPTRIEYGDAQLINAYLFVLAAFGVATRVVLPIATVSYAWLYFGSQLDSYQHHYLISLVLLLACFVPWQRPADADARTPVRSWAVRLILVQLAIMYLWAAVSKMNVAWLDGRTLAGQIGGFVRDLVDATVGTKLASRLVLVGELALAATVWLRPAWRVAAPLGIAFHISIIGSKLEIGLFAWLMLAMYALVIPDRVFVWLAERAPIRFAIEVARVIAGYFAGGARWLAWIGALGLGFALASACRFEDALATAAVVSAAAVGGVVFATVRRRGPQLAWLATAHLLAFATWLTIDRTTTVASDYYRFWGGSSRRLHDADGAERAYRKLIAIDPDEATGHYQLARLLIASNHDDEALDELHEAQRLESNHARAFVAEAKWLAAHGRRDDALAKAREAVAAEPGDGEARALVDALGGTRHSP